MCSQVKHGSRVISYALYGDQSRYVDGALENALLCKQIYPGWKMRVYHDSTVPSLVLKELSYRGVELFDMSRSHLNKMTWRFLAASDPSVDRMCSRDADSRLSQREKAAVDAWMSSGRRFHVMRDHPSHSLYPMSGGMWCCSSEGFEKMSSELETMQNGDEYMRDMEFLNKVVWPVARKSVLQHDSFSCRTYGAEPFPTLRVGSEHVGSVYLNGTMRSEDVQLLQEAIGSGKGENCSSMA